jgi:hypothetical protein
MAEFINFPEDRAMKILIAFILACGSCAAAPTTGTLTLKSATAPAPVRISDRDPEVKRDLRIYDHMNRKAEAAITDVDRARWELRDLAPQIEQAQAEVTRLSRQRDGLHAAAQDEIARAQWLAKQPIKTQSEQRTASTGAWASNTYQGAPRVIYQDGVAVGASRTNTDTIVYDRRKEADVAVQGAQLRVSQAGAVSQTLEQAQAHLNDLMARQAYLQKVRPASSSDKDARSSNTQTTVSPAPVAPRP